jgi:hypothetical protein
VPGGKRPLLLSTGLSDQGQFIVLCLVQLIWLTYEEPSGTLCREVFQWCRLRQDTLRPLWLRWGYSR